MTIKAKEFPNKIFATKDDLFKALKENKSLIIESKKAEIYKSCDKGLSITTNQQSIVKMSEASKSFEMDSEYYYFAVNSSNILDSHLDMHIDNNWEKTVKEQQGKTYLVFDHQLKRSEIVAMKQDIEMFTATIPFKAIGKDYDGNSYCLIYKVKKDKIINSEAKQWIESGYDLEASVRMQYMDIEMAMNSNNKEHSKEKATYDTYYPLIANKSDFDSIDYFWIVKQAKNVMESSLVMFGSNGATGLIQENKEPEISTLENKDEPTDVTHSEQKKLINVNFY